MHLQGHHLMSILMLRLEVGGMRTTMALDDELVAQAQGLTGLKEKSALVREALKALIEREGARRLARLGGSEPDLKAPPRRRPRRA
jgi:Arc/MetJ family transcription regulator